MPAQIGILDGILGFRDGAEHAVRQSQQPPPVRFEPVRRVYHADRLACDWLLVRLHRFEAMSRSITTGAPPDRKSTRLNSSHVAISYAVFCLKKKKQPRSQPFLKNKKTKRT